MIRLASPPADDGVGAWAKSGEASGVASAPIISMSASGSRLRSVVTNEGIITLFS
jgi:hypothetical protein